MSLALNVLYFEQISFGHFHVNNVSNDDVKAMCREMQIYSSLLSNPVLNLSAYCQQNCQNMHSSLFGCSSSLFKKNSHIYLLDLPKVLKSFCQTELEK